MSGAKKPVTIYFDSEVLLEAKHLAVDRGVPLSNLVQEALAAYMRSEPGEAQDAEVIDL